MKKKLFALALAALMLPGTALAADNDAKNAAPNPIYERMRAIIYGDTKTSQPAEQEDADTPSPQKTADDTPAAARRTAAETAHSDAARTTAAHSKPAASTDTAAKTTPAATTPAAKETAAAPAATTTTTAAAPATAAPAAQKPAATTPAAPSSAQKPAATTAQAPGATSAAPASTPAATTAPATPPAASTQPAPAATAQPPAPQPKLTKQQQKQAKALEKQRAKAAKEQARKQQKAAKEQAKKQQKAAKEKAKRQENLEKWKAREQEKLERDQEKAQENMEKEKIRLERKRAKEESDKAMKELKALPHYMHLLDDNGFSYDLDTQGSRWILLPHSTSEYILDTWVRLTKTTSDDEDAESGDYSYPPKYYLAHYYIRPKTQQIQFLSELEVSGGRPDNTVKGRGYMSQNWEDLTPGSIEDDIYRGTMDIYKKYKDRWTTLFGGDYSGPRNVRDFLEEYLRISI